MALSLSQGNSRCQSRKVFAFNLHSINSSLSCDLITPMSLFELRQAMVYWTLYMNMFLGQWFYVCSYQYFVYLAIVVLPLIVLLLWCFGCDNFFLLLRVSYSQLLFWLIVSLALTSFLNYFGISLILHIFNLSQWRLLSYS